MRVAILGYGLEGQSSENYFKNHGHETKIFDHFEPSEIKDFDLSGYDLIMRTPSIPPSAIPESYRQAVSSQTKYFFDHCPATIIGVTGTKGKGTTCKLIHNLLESTLEQDHSPSRVYLVGNIGSPSLDILDSLSENDIVVYELSSFQLWDLDKSPHIAIVNTLEPDHLNVHDGYEDYLNAKSNLIKYQSPADFCLYDSTNLDTVKIANLSGAHKIAFPLDHPSTTLRELLSHLPLPGAHNQKNAEAALLAIVSYYGITLDSLLDRYGRTLKNALELFRGLPHRMEFVREIDNVRFYDDSFCTNTSSLAVALNSFPDQDLFLILGGRDKTDNQDLPEVYELLHNTPNLQKAFLIGESGRELSNLYPNDEKLSYVETLNRAVNEAYTFAKARPNDSIVLLSPAAASFDQFDNAYARGDTFQSLVNSL